MQKNRSLLCGYENMPLLRYDSAEASELPNNVAYAELGEREVVGVLKSNRYVDGRLIQLYSTQENHVGVIAATRLGKTTSYVIPTILSFAKQKTKRSMVISDPKGELYRYTAETLRREGYKVRLINFRDYAHSECWNPLTRVYRQYRRALSVPDEVSVEETEGGLCYKFRGRRYADEAELDRTVQRIVTMSMEEVGNAIDQIASLFIATVHKQDPYWEDSARELLKGFLWAMLEDSEKESNPITEDTYSFNTILEIFSTITSGKDWSFNDNGYFKNRNKSASRAYKAVHAVILNNADTTRACILSSFNTKLAVFKDIAPRVITSCNSFEMEELAEGPIAVFINYRDELKVHFQIISMFVQDAYRYLIECANNRPDGKLAVPAYFILDEFGNFPAIKDFETTISACAGRNIFFILIIQSYAQLNNVYGDAVAAIIRDNLNMHVFMGSNNPETLELFSRECGQVTRVSPLSALNGSKETIEQYQIETIQNAPKSMLAHLDPGDCIVTEANSGYVLFSRLERYYLCDEFKTLPLSDYRQYECAVNPFDERYTYNVSASDGKKKSALDIFDFDF